MHDSASQHWDHATPGVAAAVVSHRVAVAADARRAAAAELDQARDAERHAMADAYRVGVSMYRLAQITGWSQPAVARAVKNG